MTFFLYLGSLSRPSLSSYLPQNNLPSKPPIARPDCVAGDFAHSGSAFETFDDDSHPWYVIDALQTALTSSLMGE